MASLCLFLPCNFQILIGDNYVCFHLLDRFVRNGEPEPEVVIISCVSDKIYEKINEKGFGGRTAGGTYPFSASANQSQSCLQVLPLFRALNNSLISAPNPKSVFNSSKTPTSTLGRNQEMRGRVAWRGTYQRRHIWTPMAFGSCRVQTYCYFSI